MTEILTAKKLAAKTAAAILVLVVVMAISSLVGQRRISLENVFSGPGASPAENIDYEIFVAVRLPRVILAAIVGAALGCAGVVFQGLLRNPLADPYILGISSGAGLGAIIAVIAGLSYSFLGGSAIAICAFIGSLATVWLVWFIGQFAGRSQITALLLAGVVVNAFFSAVIMFLISIAKSQHVHSTMFWLMGNITEKNFTTLWVSGAFILAGIIILFGICRQLNVISFGQQQARAMGIDTPKVKAIAFAVGAFITATAVSLSGLIGFVGLIVPHGVRLIFGPDHRQLLLLSAVTGAVFLVAADTIARIIVAPAQLPVGIITAITGGPFFLILLGKYTRKISWFGK